MKNFGIFMMDIRKAHEEHVDALVERLEAVCF